jgi:hypothetical protein
MEKLEVLRSLVFGQRVAEEEGDALTAYFVETDHWRRLYADQVDIVYGPKGAGKSALYSLLIARTDQLFDRHIILAAGENPRGAPAFKDLVTEPPTSEREFTALWKLYFACLASGVLDDLGISGVAASQLRRSLEVEGLVRGRRSLQTLLRAVRDYVRGALRRGELEAGVQIDPHTQLPTGFSGKITFREPDAKGTASGTMSVDELIRLGDNALSESGYSLWLLLDRLDVAFADSPELEYNALRALFKVYLDLRTFDRLRLKIFLRTDIWQRLTQAGFREASHITRHMTIDWNRNSLLNLVARRAAQNENLLNFYDKTREEILGTTPSQERFFYEMCPEQVDVGPNKPRTFDWMLSRTRDGSQRNAPRELIHFLNSLRDEQVRRLEIGAAEPDNGRLFVRATFKDALPEVSRTRLEQTLYAEYPSLRLQLEKIRGEKTSQSGPSLAQIWGLPLEEALALARELVEVGFFEERGSKDAPEFWIPFLYRNALELVQGSAE